MNRLARLSEKDERLCVGVLSGTSVDAAEAVVCRIRGTGANVRVELLAHVSEPFAPELIERVLKLETVAELSTLNFELGERFAEAALKAIQAAGLRTEDVDLIGSHGQTVAHRPPSHSRKHPSTLQIGEPSVIAERTGLPVVSDFRTRDIAAGGEGAPLVPYLDWAVFRNPKGRRALLNLGGIGNVSVVSEHLEDTVAFDTGPANMILDALARRATNGQLACDRDGQLSSKGTVIEPLLQELLGGAFFHRAPPKSAGREGFGESFVAPLWARYADRPWDLIATAAALTVESVARAVEAWVLPGGPPDGLYVSGGGVRNPNVLRGLAARLAPLPVLPLDALGFPEGAKEAACFALLASECVSGTPANVPSATGAKRAVILGKLVP